MLKVCRIALVMLALVSTTLFSTPAQAGMVATPKAPPATKADAEVAILKAAAERAGLNANDVATAARFASPELRSMAVAHVMAAENAGNAIAIVAIIAAAVVGTVCILSEVFWDHGFLTSYQP